MEPIGRSVLDPPLSRRMTSCGEAATYNNYDNAVARMEPLRNPGQPPRLFPGCATGSALTRRPPVLSGLRYRGSMTMFCFNTSNTAAVSCSPSPIAIAWA